MNRLSRFWHDAEFALGRRTVLILIALILIRLFSLGLYPLMDTTEGRYGEIARKMALMNDWVTPWFDIGVPFWGKPPLSFWMSAIGIKIFGVSEFAVRVPHFIAAILVSVISFDWAKRIFINPFYTTAIIVTSFLFMVSSGAVMTDMALCLGSTLSLKAFWLSLHGDVSKRKQEQWLFFIGLSLMLLAKGPVGWILVIFPIVLWSLISGGVKATWQGLPWVKGSILSILVVMPWYLIAEQHTPGFLHYFLIGEHWQRFTVSGWKGDLYGTAHATRRGTIWLDLIYGTLPWSLMLPISGWLCKTEFFVKNQSDQSKLRLYLLLTGLSPCIFFTMSGNILWTYILPGLPSLALLFALYLGRINLQSAKRILFAGSLVGALMMTGVLTVLTIGKKADFKSAKSIVELYQSQKSTKPLIFLNDHPYSAKFYSDGKSLNYSTLNEIKNIYPKKSVFIAIRKVQLQGLNEQLSDLMFVGETKYYNLYLYSN